MRDNQYDSIIFRALEFFEKEQDKLAKDDKTIDLFRQDLAKNGSDAKLLKMQFIDLERNGKILEEESKLICISLSCYVNYLEKEREKLLEKNGFVSIPLKNFENEIQLAKTARLSRCPPNWRWEYEPRKLTERITEPQTSIS
jgi:hypothetical protein